MLSYVYLFIILFVLFKLWSIIRRQFYVGGLTTKHVLITGCDTGFGRALARRLDTLGVPVFAGCLTEVGAKSLRQETSERLKTVLLDVTCHNSIVKAYEFIKDHLGESRCLWGLVNNAGISDAGGPTEFGTLHDYQKVFAVNMFGMADVTITFLPLLKKSRGRIVNISSGAGIISLPDKSVYSASKFAVVGWSESLRKNKAMWGIKVAIIIPGHFKTEILDTDRVVAARTAKWNTLPADIKEEYGDEYRDKWLERERLVNEVATKANLDLGAVVDAYQHALFSKHPKSRYLCGTNMKLLYLAYHLPIPEWIKDDLACRYNCIPTVPKILKTA